MACAGAGRGIGVGSGIGTDAGAGSGTGTGTGSSESQLARRCSGSDNSAAGSHRTNESAATARCQLVSPRFPAPPGAPTAQRPARPLSQAPVLRSRAHSSSISARRFDSQRGPLRRWPSGLKGVDSRPLRELPAHARRCPRMPAATSPPAARLSACVYFANGPISTVACPLPHFLPPRPYFPSPAARLCALRRIPDERAGPRSSIRHIACSLGTLR